MSSCTTQASIQADLEKVIREIGQIPPTDTAFSRQSELYDSGYLDSLGIVSLTAYIEQQFGVTLTDDQLFDPRFTTIEGITEIIDSSLRGGR
jgi:acyl carrier protein